MKKSKKIFTYKNKIILTNGSSIKITSVKYIKNYQLNLNIFKKSIKNSSLNHLFNQNKSNFIKKIKQKNILIKINIYIYIIQKEE